MEQYLFQGVVLPERAQLSLNVSFRFKHLISSVDATASISIVLNQVSVWIDTDVEWNVYDLRNVVRTMLQNELAVIGYLKGYAYDIDVRRVLNRVRCIDHVFGIEILDIEKRKTGIDLDAAISAIRVKTAGDEGVFLHRCFNDLVSAMKNADDTAFYCYRALEALRQHCGFRF